MEEADRRSRSYLAGGVGAIPFGDAIAAVRAELSSVEVNDILSAALGLPPTERDDLAVRLIDSLYEGFDSGDPAEVERLWLEEVERRQQRYLAGETHGTPAEEVFARLRERARGREGGSPPAVTE